MKKLRLNLNIQKELLTKEQMKKISGGSSFVCCSAGITCSPGTLWYCGDICCPGACHYICWNVLDHGGHSPDNPLSGIGCGGAPCVLIG